MSQKYSEKRSSITNMCPMCSCSIFKLAHCYELILHQGNIEKVGMNQICWLLFEKHHRVSKREWHSQYRLINEPSEVGTVKEFRDNIPGVVLYLEILNIPSLPPSFPSSLSLLLLSLSCSLSLSIYINI